VQQSEQEVTKPDDSGRTGRNWNPWIVAAIGLILVCVCVVGAAALVGGSLLVRRGDVSVPNVQQEARVERTVDVGTGATLQVDNFAGSIEAEAVGGNQIHIVAIKQGSAVADLDRIEVQIEQQGDAVLIRTRRPASLRTASVSLQIQAPAGTALNLGTGAGSIEVEGFVAPATINTSSGSIDASGLVGDVVLNTGSGGVMAESIEGTLSIDSGSGSLRVQGMDGSLEAHTGSGGIDVLGAEGNVQLDTSSGTVEYEGSPTGECRFETGSGSIVLRLPGELDFRLQADAGTGGVNVEFEVEGRVTARHVEGVVGTGQEATIVADTSSGSIDVYQY